MWFHDREFISADNIRVVAWQWGLNNQADRKANLIFITSCIRILETTAVGQLFVRY
jgi:hypothetical protein